MSMQYWPTIRTYLYIHGTTVFGPHSAKCDLCPFSDQAVELWLEIKSSKDESPRKDFEILKGKGNGKGTISYVGSKEIM